MRYYEIPQDTFDSLVTEAGILLKNFDIDAAIASPSAKGFENSDIICATTGGVQVSLTPTYSDLGEDVDNCPVNMMELKRLDSWEAKISTTGLGVSAQNIKDVLGAADIDGTGNMVVPRSKLKQGDFQSLWWISDISDNGFIAVKLFNALSTGGLSLQANKNAKSQLTLEFTGHVSLSAQDVVPMQFYSVVPDKTWTVSFNANGGTPIPSEQTVADGGKATKPTDPSKAGATFSAWCKDSTLTQEWDFDADTVTADVTLYAKYEED